MITNSFDISVKIFVNDLIRDNQFLHGYIHCVLKCDGQYIYMQGGKKDRFAVEKHARNTFPLLQMLFSIFVDTGIACVGVQEQKFIWQVSVRLVVIIRWVIAFSPQVLGLELLNAV